MNEETLFSLALEKSAHERPAFLESACGGDTELRRRVERLLKSHDNPGSFLQEPLVPSTGGRPGEATQALEPGAASPTDGPATQSDLTQSNSEDLAFLVPSTPPDALGRLDHYHILQVIGKGGFGTVLKAFDEKLHRVVAIKVLSVELSASGTARQRFIREARTAAAVSHEHVVTIHAVVEEHRPPYLVMQFIDGQTLQEKLDKVGMLSLREILRIGMQTAEGLAAAHKQGLVHRDIKPANILLENGVERVKITDFGLAKIADDASVTQSGVVAGTPMYMSPEQANGEALDHRSDLFSLGTVLYVMCTGRPPFRATGTMGVLKRVIEDAPRPIREVNPEIPEWLEDIIAKLHAKKPEERYQTAREVAELLGQRLADVQAGRAIERAGSVSDGPATPAQPVANASGSSAKRGKWAIVNAILVLALLIAAGWWYAPTISRYARGVGKVVLDANSDEVRHLLLKKDGETITLLPTEDGIELPPGDHDLEAVPIAGRVIAKCEQLRRPHFNATFSLSMPGARGKVSLARGEEVRIKVTTEAAPPDSEKKPVPQPAWVQLFNGKDLTGWHEGKAAAKNAWSVANGILKGQSAEQSMLWTDRADFKDFHLRVNARIEAKTDSGVNFRHSGFMKGYQADIHATSNFTGSLWGSGDLLVKTPASTAIKPQEWFTLEVIAQGSRIKILVNGQTTAEVTDSTSLEGRFALQISGKGGSVEFEKIEIKELPPLPQIVLVRKFEGHKKRLKDVAVSPDGRYVVSGGYGDGVERPVRVWELSSGDEVMKGFDFNKDGTEIVVLSPSGKYLATRPGDPDKHTYTVKLWDFATGKHLCDLKGHPDYVQAAVFSQDDRHVFTCGKDKTIRMWDVLTGKELHKIDSGVARADLVVSRDGKQLYFTALSQSGSGTNLVAWDVNERKETKRSARQTPAAWALALSPDGKTICGGGYKDGQIYLWDLWAHAVCAERKAHDETVTGVAFTLDGRHIITTALDRTIKIWDATTLDLVTAHEAATYCTNHLALMPDGRHIVTCGGHYREGDKDAEDGDYAVRLWRLPESVWPASAAHILTSDEYEWTEPKNLGPKVNSAGGDGSPWVSADGLTLLFSSPRPGGLGDYDLWQCTRSRVEQDWSEPLNLGAPINSKGFETQGAMSADGRTLVFTAAKPGGQGEMDLWMATRTSRDAAWGDPVNLGAAINSPTNDQAPILSDDGLQLSFMSVRDGVYKGWISKRTSVNDAWSRPELFFDGRGSGLQPLDSGKTILCSPDNQRIGLAAWNAADKRWGSTEILPAPINDGNHNTRMFYHASTQTLYFESDRPGGQGKTDLWMSRRVTKQAKAKDEITLLREFEESHPGTVHALAVTPDGRHVLSGSIKATDRSVLLHDRATGKLVYRFDSSKEGFGMAISEDGRRAVVSARMDLCIYDLPNRKLLHRKRAHENACFRVSISPDGKYVLTGSGDRTAAVWELETGEEVARIPLNYDCWAAAFMPDGKIMLGGWAGPGVCELWDWKNRKRLSSWRVPAWIKNIDIAPDGRSMLVCGHDGLVRLLDLASNRYWDFEGHKGIVWSVKFLPDGRHCISGGEDGTCRVWSLESKKVIASQVSDTRTFNTLAVTPDGREVVAGGGFLHEGTEHKSTEDYALRLWQLPESVWPTPADEINLMRRFEVTNAAIQQLQVTPNGNQVVSISGNHFLQIHALPGG